MREPCDINIMKKSELKKMREKKATKLNEVVVKKRLELLKVRADIKASRESNLKSAKNLRREIAQLLTLIREQELVEEAIGKKMEKKSNSKDNK